MFLCHAEHFPDALFPGHPTAVSYMGKLVGIVAQTGYFPQKLRMMLTGSCPDFAAHDKGTDIFLTGQAAFLYLLFQKTQLLRIEADWYHMVSFLISSPAFQRVIGCCSITFHDFPDQETCQDADGYRCSNDFFFIWASPPFRYLAQHHRGEHDPSLSISFANSRRFHFFPSIMAESASR